MSGAAGDPAPSTTMMIRTMTDNGGDDKAYVTCPFCGNEFSLYHDNAIKGCPHNETTDTQLPPVWETTRRNREKESIFDHDMSTLKKNIEEVKEI